MDAQVIVAIVSASISLIAIGVSVHYSRKSHKQYLKSLDPELSFKLVEFNNILYLKIVNTGKSAAQHIKVEVNKMENNGERNELILDSLFKTEFDLYPEESTQGQIAFWGETICDHVFPKVYIDVHYKKYISNDQVNEMRTVIFSPGYGEKIYGDFNIDLRELNKNMAVVARANLRTANYLDGCQVAPFDELNILAHKSLHDDLLDVNTGEGISTVIERSDVIKKRM